MNICFVKQSWEDYNYWALNDKKIFLRLQSLIKETLRDPYGGIGKPEALKANLIGYWSKRIDHEHRLVYKVDNDNLIIISCRYHY